MLRGHAGVPAHVLVLTTHGAQRRRGLGLTRRKARKPRSAASPPPPATGATARATIVRAEPFASIAAAEAWRAGVDPAAEALAAVRVLNRVLHAQRTAAADPSVREVALAAALAVRVGVGLGDQVAHGLWTGAVELPRAAGAARGERSAAALRPQERLAAIFGGRDVALAC